MVVQEYFGKLHFYVGFENNFGVCQYGVNSENYNDLKRVVTLAIDS